VGWVIILQDHINYFLWMHVCELFCMMWWQVLVVDVVIVVVSCLVTWSLGSYFSLLCAANL